MVDALAYAGALALWVLAAGLPDDGVARWAGALVFHLLVAALIRWLWIRPQRLKPSFMSPWLFAIAAGVALLGRVGQNAT